MLTLTIYGCYDEHEQRGAAALRINNSNAYVFALSGNWGGDQVEGHELVLRVVGPTLNVHSGPDLVATVPLKDLGWITAPASAWDRPSPEEPWL